jgi:hypothetical protein
MDNMFARLFNAHLKPAPAPDRWPDDLLLAQLTKKDALRLSDAFAGTFVSGRTGSGKTSGPGRLLAKRFLRANFGGLVLCQKNDEPDLWRKYLDETGRTGDGVFFGENPAHSFNFIDYESAAAGIDLSENIVNLLIEAASVTSTEAKSGKDEAFWLAERKKLIRNMLGLLLPVDKSTDMRRMKLMLDDAPRSIEQAESAKWKGHSMIWRYLQQAEKHYAKRGHEFELISNYWMREFPAAPDKQRGAVEADFTGLFDSFLRGKMFDIFCRGTTTSPDDVLTGKVIVVALPVSDYHEVGQYAGVIWKYLTQRAAQRRRIASPETVRPVFIWADEAQYFANRNDQTFQTTARSSRICTVYMTQNLPNYYVAFGGQGGEHRVHSLLGNLATKFFCQNDDNVTNEWAAKTIDKATAYKITSTHSGSIQSTQGVSESLGLSEQEEFSCQTREFLQLATGGIPNNRIVEAIAFRSGHTWRNGKRWVKVAFDQGY